MVSASTMDLALWVGKVPAEMERTQPCCRCVVLVPTLTGRQNKCCKGMEQDWQGNDGRAEGLRGTKKSQRREEHRAAASLVPATVTPQ